MSNVRWLADQSGDTPPTPPPLLVYGEGCNENVPPPAEPATNTALIVPGVSLEARDAQAMTVQAYQQQMAYPAILRDFKGLVGDPQLDLSDAEPSLPEPEAFGYSHDERDDTMETHQTGLGAVPKSGVRWLEGPPTSRLGATNPPVPVDLTAWNFTSCTYTMRSGDTIDGIAQTYMQCPPGAWVPGGTTCINAINQLNLSNPLIAAGKQNLLPVGTVLRMPASACAYAKSLYDKAKAACAAQGGTWDENSKSCTSGTQTPVNVGDCSQWPGTVYNPQSGECECAQAGYAWSDVLNKCMADCTKKAPCPAGYKVDSDGECLSSTPKCPNTDGHSVLCPGDSGPGVLEWNSILVRDVNASKAQFTPDDGYGLKTLAATVAWQQFYGITPADGVVRADSWAKACANQLAKCSKQTDCTEHQKCVNGKCTDMPQCKSGNSQQDLTVGNCWCPTGTTWSEAAQKCMPICKAGEDPTKGTCACPYGTIWNAAKGQCLPPCQTGYAWDAKGDCVPGKPTCKTGEEYVAVLNACLPVCPKGKKRDPKSGNCVNAVVTASSGSDAGLLILGLGAVVALALSFGARGKTQGAAAPAARPTMMARNPRRYPHFSQHHGSNPLW